MLDLEGLNHIVPIFQKFFIKCGRIYCIDKRQKNTCSVLDTVSANKVAKMSQ